MGPAQLGGRRMHFGEEVALKLDSGPLEEFTRCVNLAQASVHILLRLPDSGLA